MNENSLSFLTVIYMSFILLFAGLCESLVNPETIYYSSIKKTAKKIVTSAFN